MDTTDGVRELYLRLLRAWNDRDAQAMGDCFATDGAMIGFDGSIVDGRTRVIEHLAPIFADHPTASYVTIVRSVRSVGDTAILLADAGMRRPGADAIIPEANARQTIVATRSGDAWSIDLFQNTPAALHGDEDGRTALTAELAVAHAP
ncbi:SgcJ/EcaC family oxidoreductase [Brevibacterium jeotgali]|nr:SgcJ/EcaC family oxidoreductase [Brevibacterium jeotgali]